MSGRAAPRAPAAVHRVGARLRRLTAAARLSRGSLSAAAARAGQTVQVGIDPSKTVITKLKIDNDRKRLLDRKNSKAHEAKGKGKYTEAEAKMQDVD